MEPKKGDRVSLDAKKVGQPRRGGVVRSITQGISAVRYQIEWDDGSQSVIAPGAGILLVERRSSTSKNSKAVSGRVKSKPVKASKAKKAGGKAKTGKRR